MPKASNFIIGCFILSAAICNTVNAAESKYFKVCNEIQTNLPGTCLRDRYGREHCTRCVERADIPGVYSGSRGCLSDPTNNMSPLDADKAPGTCRSVGFPVCCHIPWQGEPNKLRLVSWYKPGTQCSAMPLGKKPCPFGGNLVKNAQFNRLHLQYTDMGIRYWKHYPTIYGFWKRVARGKIPGRRLRRSLFDPYWTNQYLNNLDEADDNENVGFDPYWTNRYLNNLDEADDYEDVGGPSGRL